MGKRKYEWAYQSNVGDPFVTVRHNSILRALGATEEQLKYNSKYINLLTLSFEYGQTSRLAELMVANNVHAIRRTNIHTEEVSIYSMDINECINIPPSNKNQSSKNYSTKPNKNHNKKETGKYSGNCSDKTLMDAKNEVKSRCESMCHVLAGYFGFKMPHIFVGLDSITNPDEYKWWAYIHIAKRKAKNLKKYSGEAEDIFNRTSTDNYTTGEFGKAWKEDGGRSGFITIAFGCYSEDSAKLLEQAFITDFDLRNSENGFNKR